jgi:phage portal protein BeeE
VATASQNGSSRVLEGPWLRPRRVNEDPFPRPKERIVRSDSNPYGDGLGGFLGELLSGTSHFAGQESVTRPYEQAGWVHACIKAIASAVRSCPLVFYEEDPKTTPGAQPIADDHPLAKLFRRPNGFQTPATFFEAGVHHRKLDGEDFWFMFNAQKFPVAVERDAEGVDRYDYPDFIIPVRGKFVEEERDQMGLPVGWKYSIPKRNDGDEGGKVVASAGSVIHFADYDPDNPTRGLGDVLVVMREIALEFGAQRYLEAMLRHSGDPGGTITTENEMNHEEERRAAKEAEEAFGLHNVGRWRVVSGKGIKYQQNAFGPKDMQFQELLQHTKGKEASVLGVPLPVIGDLDEATYSNYGTAVRQFWENGNGVLSYMASVEDMVNNRFLPGLKDESARGYVARFDTSHVEALQEDNAEKLELAKDLAQANVGVSFEEGAALAGLRLKPEATEFGGVAWLPPNITTAEEAEKNAGKISEGQGQPPPSGDGDEEKPFPGSSDFEETDEDRAAPVEQREGDAANAPSQQEPPDHLFDARRTYYKAVESGLIAPSEKRVRRAASRYLKRYETAQIRRLEAFAEGRFEVGVYDYEKRNPVSPQDIVRNEELMEILLLSYAEWVEKLADDLSAPIGDVFIKASAGITDEIGGIVLQADDPFVLEFLRKQVIRLSEGVNSTLAKLVRKALVEVFEAQGFDMATMQQHVTKLLPELKGAVRKAFNNREARASAIARTETNRAANGARWEQMRREGVEEHQWVTSGDVFVRKPPKVKVIHSHVALDGQIRAVGDSFRDTETLKYPSDPEGNPEDVINCRCVTRPIVKD